MTTIEIKQPEPPKGETKNAGDLQYGTVFSGKLNNTTGIFLVCDKGIYYLNAPASSAFGLLFYEFSIEPSWPNITNYKELNATLKIDA